jgi:hypothetical protein
VQKGVEPAFAEPLAAHRLDQPPGGRGYPVSRLGRNVRNGENGHHRCRLVLPMGAADPGAQRGLGR